MFCIPVSGETESLGGGNEERKSVFLPDCRACVESSALGWVNAEIRSVRQSDVPVAPLLDGPHSFAGPQHGKISVPGKFLP